MKAIRTRLLIVPAVMDMSSFRELASHVGHYLGHLDCERILIPIDPSILDEATGWLSSPTAPPGFDPSILKRVEAVVDQITFKAWPSNLEPIVRTSDFLLDWDIGRTTMEPWASIKKSYRSNRTLFEVDWRGTRLGASWFAEAAMILNEGRAFNPERTSNLRDLAASLGPVENAYLVGTGPSVGLALDHDMSDALRIVCNTTVLDRALMDHIQPHIVAFADPIFHFGPSTYAQSFQRAVLEESARHDFIVVTTERFAPMLENHVPELAGRIVGLRQGVRTWADNLDLLRFPAVKPYPNVLTMLMLPLAATFARRISLIGFDGRGPGEAYFWKHGSTVQFERELHEIRIVHPGFFEVDYEDYYQKHVADLEAMIRRMEVLGHEVMTLAPSYMMPLKRRFRAVSQPRPEPATGTTGLVSLTPDWVDDFGHFGPFERRIHLAANEASVNHVSLASTGLEATENWQFPTFTGFPSNVAQGNGRFLAELSQALESLTLRPESVVAMYAGDVWHIPNILEVARRFPQSRFVLNLMKSHAWLESAITGTNPWASSLADLLKECLNAAEGTNVEVTVDSEALASDVELLVGHALSVWPMIAISQPGIREPKARSRLGNGVHIVSPVHAHLNKGFPEVAQLSQSLRSLIDQGTLRLTVRFAPQPTPIPDEVEASIDTLLTNGAVAVRENLSDGQYAALIDSADVVLVPYRLKPFRTRTSGVVLDALTAGKPVVTVRGTWAGDLVERLEVGATYEEGNAVDMESALLKVVRAFREYQAHVRGLTGAIHTEFAPERLIEFLFDGRPHAEAPPDEDVVADVTSRAERLRELFQWRAESEQSSTIRLAIANDDRRRTVDSLKDRGDFLEGALDWHRQAAEKHHAPKPPVDLGQSLSRLANARLDESELVARILDPDGIKSGLMVDVGAHHGSTLGHFLRRGWKVLAFEPDERHFLYLQDRFGNDERIQLDSRAVTSATGELRQFYTSEESSGVSSLAPFLESHVKAGTVTTVSLDDALNDQHVTVLKVDTEGFDLEVLEGFPWERDIPDAIICEFEDRKTLPLGYSTMDLGDYLIERGYQVWMSEWHPVVRYGQHHDWKQLKLYPCKPTTPEAWGNFIAFREPRSEADLGLAMTYSLHVDNEDPPVVAESQDSKAGGYQSQSMMRRRSAVSRALTGSLRPAIGAGVFFSASSAFLALIDQGRWAIASAAAGIASAVVGILIVATRLERRVR